MSASLATVEVGSHVAVDEAICGFEGQSRQQVTIKSKTNTHRLEDLDPSYPGIYTALDLAYARRCPRPYWPLPSRRKRDPDDPYDINPTQAVVVKLIEALPRQIYHVYLDNLFLSPQLFRRLRQLYLGVGATGTVRTNARIYNRLVKAKEDDRKGRILWPLGRIESYPTEDNLVNQIG
ncbi:hypothetical protein S40285_09769 [Stachybotrys chlorohalonatus IBT 40285]|uniref:PiggyBac transposable element-derived protein domain-containing protein n=1 Tax=Stachybotrys chlorohalonatus (strain IBT 40285) TaxID=1283841 RepID=A0A084QT47_STAC4|nr:hypothetical protein S40285_09769 [Stachybotrys chlorohalonata IBT 40285]